ncbi:MAG: alpha/beta hydrolase [Burkholderiales bacterium]|nr:alpha/beta hydrolase [Burkholderiales bacterium]
MSRYFKEVLKEGDFSITDVFTEVKKDFPALDLSRIEPLIRTLFKMRGRITAISYNTVDPLENPVLSSGIIMRPINRKPRGVLHFLPSANIDKFGSGSDALILFEGVLSFLGYIVIIPDLLGNGITKDTVEYPFLMAENTGQVAYDMHRAAIEYYQEVLGHPLPKHISIGGYSMGGSGALALVRHIERENPSDIIVDRAIIGGGLYDLNVAFEEFAKTGFAQYPAAPGVFKAYDKWYNLNLDYSRVFTGPLLENMDSWLDRTHYRDQLTEWIGQDLHKYMHPDFFTPERNSEIKKLWDKFRENSLADGWTPKTHILIAHASDDLSVPTRVATYTVEQFRKRGARIRSRYGKGGHYEFGKWFFLRMGIHLILKRMAFWTRF